MKNEIKKADNSKIAETENKSPERDKINKNNNNFKEVQMKKNTNRKANAEMKNADKMAKVEQLVNNCKEMEIEPTTKWSEMTEEQRAILKENSVANYREYVKALAEFEKNADNAKAKLKAKWAAEKAERQEKGYNFENPEDMQAFCRMVAYCRTKFVADKVAKRQIENADGNGKTSPLFIIANYIVRVQFADVFAEVVDDKSNRKLKTDTVGFRNAEYERAKEILQIAHLELCEVVKEKGKWFAEWSAITETAEKTEKEMRFEYARRKVSNAVSRELYATKTKIVNVDITDAETVESYKFPNPEATVINKMTIEGALKNAMLTETESEILKKFAYGYSYKEIADEMGIAEKTVDNHLRNARVKLGQRNFRYVITKI